MAEVDCRRLNFDTRRLWSVDHSLMHAHFLRLNATERRQRFGIVADDAFLNGYLDRIRWLNAVVFGAFVEGELRGLGELHCMPRRWPMLAEAALSVEGRWQSSGLGEALLGQVIMAAQIRAVQRIVMYCLKDNEPMQRLARKHTQFLRLESGDVEAQLDPLYPTVMSLVAEAMDHTDSYLGCVFKPS